LNKFLIADDHPLFREALKSALLNSFEGLTIIEADCFSTTLKLVTQECELDLLLLDLHMPGNDGLNGLIRLRELHPELPVAIVSGSEDLNIVAKVMTHGALAFIPKSSSSGEISMAINEVLQGEVWLPQDLREKINALKNEDAEQEMLLASLTPQQSKVLSYLHQGLLNKQIAYELNISEATVKAHITVIFRKLGVYNRTQAVLLTSKLQLES
jgi:DNA-binding NarL/FixJ family response regulator